MVQKLGGPTNAIEAVKPPLRTAMGAIGLQAYAPVGLVDADAVLNKKKKKPSKPSKPAKPAKPALPSPPPAPPKKKFSSAVKEYQTKEKAAAPKTNAVAVQIKGGKKKGLGRFLKEALTNLKNKVVKRKDAPAKK